MIKLSNESMVKLIEWFSSDDTGMSSEAIATTLTTNKTCYSHPYDPSDFYRCMKLFKSVPELKPHLHKMAEVSEVWKRLVIHWDEIEDCLLKEKSISNKAPETYKMIKAVIKND